MTEIEKAKEELAWRQCVVNDFKWLKLKHKYLELKVLVYELGFLIFVLAHLFFKWKTHD